MTDDADAELSDQELASLLGFPRDDAAVAPDDGDTPPNMHFAFLLGLPRDEEAIFTEYLDRVANGPLRMFKERLQFGMKDGESLFIHIMNGIAVLEQLRRLLSLSELHTRILFCAFTLHDLNKWIEMENPKRYRDIATLEAISEWMARLSLDRFFEGYLQHLDVIAALMWGHSGHHVTNFDVFAQPQSMDHHLIERLTKLIQAADAIDLSRTIDEPRKKQDFLHHVNASSPTAQYALFSHRCNEQRGAFTNIVHNAVSNQLQRHFQVTPLLLYPEGTVYLVPRAAPPIPDEELLQAIAADIAASIKEKTTDGFEQFIEPRPLGIKVDAKCLELGLPFASLLGKINTIIERRSYADEKIQELRTDAEQRVHKQYGTLLPATQALVDGQLARGTIGATAASLRVGELVRSYYIFLADHGRMQKGNAWQHLYQLFSVTDEQRQLLDAFDARMDRGYVLATLLDLSPLDVYVRIVEDGSTLFDNRQQADDRLPLLMAYVRHVVSFDGGKRSSADFQPSTGHYVQRQHKQCVLCSLPFPTQPWSALDVRSDIKVQVFSNRLPGAPMEPKKYICGICHLQYLVEKLNYREIRGEHLVYLHAQPYSFLAAPLANSLQITFSALLQSSVTAGPEIEGAMRLSNIAQIMHQQVAEHQLTYTGTTQKGTPQPYGLYVPRYSDTVGGMMTFPINPVGDTDTERFLFIAEYALVVQRALGCKILVSTSAAPPLDKEAFGTIYFDFIPLSARGLIRHNDYAAFLEKHPHSAWLPDLWTQFNLLYAIHMPLLTLKNHPLRDLVRSMAEHPLQLFYTAEKLAEERVRGSSSRESSSLIAQIAPHVRELAMSIGDPLMNTLDQHLARLAQLAREYNLRGSSWKKHSMITAIDEMLRKVSLMRDELSSGVIRAAAAQDLFDHLNRVKKIAGYGAGKKVQEGCEEFVRIFFDDIFTDVYSGKLNRLLSHEKVLRSAYHFYIQQEYHRKPLSPNEQDADPIVQDAE